MKDMRVFEREVNGRRYRIAAQSVWDSAQGRSVARQAVLGPATAPPVADLGATRTVGTQAVGDVGALIWVAEQLDLITHIDRACGNLGAQGGRRSESWPSQSRFSGHAHRGPSGTWRIF